MVSTHVIGQMTDPSLPQKLPYNWMLLPRVRFTNRKRYGESQNLSSYHLEVPGFRHGEKDWMVRALASNIENS